MNVHDKSLTPPVGVGLEIDLLRTFLAIVETGSFKKAGDQVFRTPSAVSMQIKKLEEIMGRSVFRRDARAVTLTPDGEILLVYARRLLNLADEAMAQFRKPEVEGIVRLGAPDEYGERFLPHLLKRFKTTHPGVIVDVVIDFSSRLIERVREGELDLTAISCSSEMAAHDDVDVLFEEELVWGGVKGGCAHLEDPVPVSLWEEGCAWRNAALGGLQKAGKNYRVSFLSAHTAGQKAAVVSDLAVAPLPKGLMEAPLVTLGEKHGLPPLGTYMIGMIKGRNLGPAGEVLAQHLKASFDDERVSDLIPSQSGRI